MIHKQQSRCAICGTRLVSPHIDHDHATGTVRGILCPPCNHGLGHFRDSVINLRRAIKYLKRARSPPRARSARRAR
jgi:Recombination endonuclease VII